MPSLLFHGFSNIWHKTDKAGLPFHDIINITNKFEKLYLLLLHAELYIRYTWDMSNVSITSHHVNHPGCVTLKQLASDEHIFEKIKCFNNKHTFLWQFMICDVYSPFTTNRPLGASDYLSTWSRNGWAGIFLGKQIAQRDTGDNSPHHMAKPRRELKLWSWNIDNSSKEPGWPLDATEDS